MSRKSSKSEEIIDALCDERVSSKLLDKLSGEIILRIDQKFKDLSDEINESLKASITKITSEILKESLTPIKQEVLKLKERVEILEANAIQNDLYICGMKLNEPTNTDSTQIKSQVASDSEALISVLEHIRNNLQIPIDTRDINYVYPVKKKSSNDRTSQILVSFSSTSKKYEVMKKAKLLSKQDNTYPKIFYNERLTKKNAEISFKARMLQRTKRILSTWIYKGEVYIRKGALDKPIKIVTINDLTAYE